MRASVRLTTALLCSLSLMGCFSAGHIRNKKWEHDFTYIKMIRSELDESAKLNFDCANYKSANTKMNWVDQARCYMHDPDNTPVQKAELRNWIIENFVTFANHAFGDFEHDSVVRRSAAATGFEFINLGLTASTTVFGLATPLGAAATATQGAQHSWDKNFYNAQTSFVINNKMEALRLEQLVKIREREVLPVNCPAPAAPASGVELRKNGSQPQCYTLEQAMNDVQDLFYAGSVHRALQDINNQTSDQTTKAQNKLKTLNNQAIQ